MAVLFGLGALHMYLSLLGPNFGSMLGQHDKAAKLASGGLQVLLQIAPVYYALNYGAMGRPAVLVWPMLTIDAVVVGFLALTITGSLAIAAMRAATSKGVALIPKQPGIKVGAPAPA